MQTKLIGHVGVDSGQLLLCDPCYIDSQWVNEDFEDVRIYKHKVTGDTVQYRKDFANYEEVIPKYGQTMNQLIATNEWDNVETPPAKNNFSYNACAQATLSDEGHGQLNYQLGHPGIGVAFSTAIGDGYYPVYAVYNNEGHLIKVEVVFDEELFEDDDEIF